MTLTLALTDTHVLWYIALGLGAVVIVVVIALMLMLLSLVKDIDESVDVLLEGAGGVANNVNYILQLVTTAEVLEQIKDEAVVQYTYFAGAAGAQ